MNTQSTQVQTKTASITKEKIAVVVMLLGALFMLGAIAYALVTVDPNEVGKTYISKSVLECAREYWDCPDRYLEYECKWQLNDCLTSSGYQLR